MSEKEVPKFERPSNRTPERTPLSSPKGGASEQLHDLGSRNADEGYSPLPPGYVKGRTKYVVVTGSVISGIGKGVFTSALCKLFTNRGLKCAPMKSEAYLNVDAGTISPFRHGEVFVLDDGTETDMDLGSYERFLGEDLSRDNFITAGSVYKRIVEKERAGKYLGRDVQFTPHVTGETKLVFRNLAMNSQADVVLCEVGGTVGDYENMYLMEAFRELRHEEGHDNVCVVNLTYILEPSSLGEFKTKAAQNGIRSMMQLGLIPDVIVCRSENPITSRIVEKISLASNVPSECVIAAHNVGNLYTLPLFLREQGVDSVVLRKLQLESAFPLDDPVRRELLTWTQQNVVERPVHEVTVGIAGKYTNLVDAYASLVKALEHCAAATQTRLHVRYIETSELTNASQDAVAHALAQVDGLIVPGGFGSRGTEGKIRCIQYVRERGIPFLGLCYGMQTAVIEFARNVCNLKGANTTEIDAECEHPVVHIMPEQEEIEGIGGSMRLGGYDVVLSKDTIAHELYSGKESVRERFRHRYNVNTKYIETIEQAGGVFSGRAPSKRIMQAFELPRDVHPHFFAVQYHPEFTSRPLHPNPCFLGFVKACIQTGRSLTHSLLSVKSSVMRIESPSAGSRDRFAMVKPQQVSLAPAAEE